MGRRRWLAPLAVALVVAAALAPVSAPAAPSTPLSQSGRWITDARGRVVILHGWNMVYKVGSYRPADTGFGADEARLLARHGFNTIRLGVIYKRLEPQLPRPSGRRYRDAYLDSVAVTERQLSSEGIFTLLDFHQDMHNERFEGEGFPDWAVVGDARTLPAEPKQGFPPNYLVMPALNRAFDHVWPTTSPPTGGGCRRVRRRVARGRPALPRPPARPRLQPAERALARVAVARAAPTRRVAPPWTVASSSPSPSGS